ncbi:MAG: flippase [Anaerolineaceae bacterium]
MDEKNLNGLDTDLKDPSFPSAEIIQISPIEARAKTEDILTAAKGGGISFAGRLFEYVVRFAFGILIARVVGVEQYGLYTLAITVSLIASNMAMLGLQTGMVRFLPPAIRMKDDQSIWEIIQVCVGIPVFFSLLLALGIYLLASPLASLLFHDPRMVPLLRIVSLLIPLDALASMTYVITISFKQPKYSVITNNIISPLLKLLLAAGFLAVGLSTKGVLLAQIISTAIALVVLIYYVNSLFSLKRVQGSSKRLTWKLLSYSLPVHMGWMVNTLRSTFSTLILGFLGLAIGVGVYTAASRFSLIGQMFYLSIGNISTPIIADLHSHGETSQMKAFYQTTTRWLLLFNLPVFLTSFLFAKQLLWIFGDDFTTGATSMMILAVGTLAYTSTGVGANILDMTDHPKVNTANAVVMVFITIILNILFVPKWEVVGAAIASAISTVLINIVCLVEVWVLLKMQPYDRSLFKPLAAGMAATMVAILINYFLDLPELIQLIVGGGMLWIVYALVLFFLRFPPDDRVVFERLISRVRAKRPTTQDVKSC